MSNLKNVFRKLILLSLVSCVVSVAEAGTGTSHPALYKKKSREISSRILTRVLGSLNAADKQTMTTLVEQTATATYFSLPVKFSTMDSSEQAEIISALTGSWHDLLQVTPELKKKLTSSLASHNKAVVRANAAKIQAIIAKYITPAELAEIDGL